MAWHGGGCVFAAVCKYAARRLQSIAAHSFTLTVFTFAVAVAVLRMVTLSLYRMIHVCSSCVWKSIVATVPADLSSRVSW